MPDQEAELIAETWLAVFVAVASGVKGLRLIRLAWFGGLWSPTELLD